MDLSEFCSSLAAELSVVSTEDEKIEITVQALSDVFHVTPEEVAILGLDSRLQILNFLWPLPLRKAGSLPLSVENSLAVRTLKDSRASLDNAFSSTPHATIFEHFQLEPDMTPLPIQKIMSAPVMREEEIMGIIQVSRKGSDPASAGEDFSQLHLAALSRIAAVFGNAI